MNTTISDTIIHLGSVFGITAILGFFGIVLFVVTTFTPAETPSIDAKNKLTLDAWSVSHTGIATALGLCVLLVTLSVNMTDRGCHALGDKAFRNTACGSHIRYREASITTKPHIPQRDVAKRFS